MTTETISDNEALAVEFMGWKWLAYVGTPVRSHPGYPQKCRIRQLHSPSMMADERWKEFFKRTEVSDADGTEPLHYSYCSSGGCSFPEYNFDGKAFAEVEQLLEQRGLLGHMSAELREIFGKEIYRPSLSQCCAAALSLLRKHSAKC